MPTGRRTVVSFWDNTNHRFGIGTAAPAEALEVNAGLGVRENSPFIITTDGGTITVGNRSYLRGLFG